MNHGNFVRWPGPSHETCSVKRSKGADDLMIAAARRPRGTCQAAKIDPAQPRSIRAKLISSIFLFLLLMSTAGGLEIPKGIRCAKSTPSGPVPPPSVNAIKIVVEGQAFVITEESPTASFGLGKLRRTEDDSYVFPDEWKVRSAQFSALLDLLRSPR